ncbi:OmpA family protein [Saprospira grandis]|uniref:OmpA family protein n=1 Tax=Saprospira grandis TaxID=1008 RepID=UPI0022DDD4E3|nr:OmpA family protein [Saprospira grandis]WBM75400.1 OmpA family protein [Saprospira grandis]
MKKLYLSCLLMLLSFGMASAQDLQDSFELYFEFNRAILKQESKTQIDSFLEATKGRRLGVRIAGYTCDIGTENYNMGLSERRAESAFEYLKEVGEPEDKMELFFYGEKDLKYGQGGVAENRRVYFLFTLEDDDRDTLLQKGCLEVFVEKGTFKPKKNKDITFTYKSLSTAREVAQAGIKMEDENGKGVYANAIAYFDAKVDGNALEAGKTLKVKMPAVGEDAEGFMLYTGVDNGGTITWKSTGKPCGSLVKEGDCSTYNFEMEVNGYCGCLKPRACEEDCSEDPFGGERLPNLEAADIRYSSEGSVAQIKDGTYTQDIANMDVQVVDEPNKESDCDICEQFQYGIATEDWFPAYANMNDSKNVIVKAKNSAGEAQQGDGNRGMRIMLPRDKVTETNPVLLTGRLTKQGYMKWETSKYEQATCLGPINCDYIVFDVPATGNYKLGEWNEEPKAPGEDTYVLKTRVLRNSTILVANKKTGYVYRAKNVTRKGKTRTKEYHIRQDDNMDDIIILQRYQHKKKAQKKRYAEVKLTDLKYKKKKKMYVLRKRTSKKIKEWDEMDLNLCK